MKNRIDHQVKAQQGFWPELGEIKQQLGYWQKQLADAPTLLQLPTDYPRPAVQSYRGSRQTFRFSAALTQQLERFSQSSGVTLYMTLLAGFGTLLYRYSGQCDLLIGSPITNRNWAESEPSIGCFINTLVLRLQFENDLSFAQMLSQVRETALDSYDHQDVPFEQIAEALQPERSLSHSPLFQVMFVLQNTPQEALDLPEVTSTPLASDLLSTTLDLTLSMEMTASGLVGSWEYCIDLFAAETITRMSGHLQQLLEAAVSAPETSVSRLPLLTEEERHQLLVQWNDTAIDYPQNQCIHQLFEAQVEETPDAVAVVFESQKLTYQDLNARANQLAHYLQGLGVKPETLVGLCVERSLDMLVGLLGILKAGGAYVPLDPSYPKERLQFMLQDSAVPVLLTQQKLISELPTHDVQVICVDADRSRISRCRTQTVDSQVQPDNLAYVIYTSGSTGKPKGVMIQHQSVVNFLTSMRLCPGLGQSDCLNAVTTLSFDIAVLELYLPLICGARVTIVPRQVARDGGELALQLQQAESTVMQATPVTWKMLLESSWSGLDHDFAILCGGEGLSVSLSEQLLQITDKLWNLYGPTETTVWSACYQVSTQLETRTGVVKGSQPIGRPIANTQIYLLDAYLQPVPIGVVGELHIGGVGLARGYLNRPELTTEKFIPNPFGPGRLYKTGDLARYLPDGNIECLGRIDHQVKIRGFRIELGEVEAALSKHPQVQQVGVIVREDAPGNQQLAAYVVSQEIQLSFAELRNFLKTQLPDYMVPSLFVQLETLPLTPNGKVNYQVLPAPDQSRTSLGKDFALPRTATEARLAAIWSNLLRVDEISIHDDFFQMGGHSLMAVQLFAQIEKAFGKTLPLVTLLQASTIAELANELHDSRGAQPWSSLVAIQHQGSKPPLFCIHGVGANVLSFRELAHYLGPEQPFYGLQARGLDGREPPLNEIEDMACQYLQAIQEIYPKGPYLLAGYCSGSLIALEIAHMLDAQGATVALLALLEPYPIRQSLVKRSLMDRVEDLRNRLTNQGFLHTITYQYQKIVSQIYQRFGLPLSSDLQLIRVRETILQASRKYATKIYYPHKATLFLTSESVLNHPDLEQLWENVTGELEIHKIHGRHQDDLADSCLKDPHVKSLATQLKALIDKAVAA
jgi:amino acid adenylation domain-containing protein